MPEKFHAEGMELDYTKFGGAIVALRDVEWEVLRDGTRLISKATVDSITVPPEWPAGTTRDLNKADFAEAWKLLGEVAEMDPWTKQDPYTECFFCGGSFVSSTNNEHVSDCLWVRTRAFMERFRA